MGKVREDRRKLWACEGQRVGLQSIGGGRKDPQNSFGVERGPRAHCPEEEKPVVI